jgi:hypothetical protein
MREILILPVENFPHHNPAEPEPKGFAQKLAILLFGKRIRFV